LKPNYIPAFNAFVFFTVLLLLPGSAFPEENFLTRIQFDKWVHVGIFTLLVVLFCWGSLRKQRGTKSRFIKIAIAMLLYGIAIEFIQHYFIKNRGFELGDILADAGGCLIGYFFSSHRYIKK
jgi:VanZ family protein